MEIPIFAINIDVIFLNLSIFATFVLYSCIEHLVRSTIKLIYLMTENVRKYSHIQRTCFIIVYISKTPDRERGGRAKKKTMFNVYKLQDSKCFIQRNSLVAAFHSMH